MHSKRLIQVLEMVLNIGNLMNAGSVNGGVEAFKFESLPRLSQTKSADGKMTVLDYIVETFIEKGDMKALLLLGEFPDIQVSRCLEICTYFRRSFLLLCIELNPNLFIFPMKLHTGVKSIVDRRSHRRHEYPSKWFQTLQEGAWEHETRLVIKASDLEHV